MSTETIRLIRDGGKGVWRWGGEGDYIPGCFIIVRDKVTRQDPQTINSEEKGEPKRIQTGDGDSLAVRAPDL